MFFLIGLLTFALSSCASPRFEPGPHLQLVSATELPPPADVQSGDTARGYRIGAFDRLSVSVFGVPELTRETQVDSSGRIALPLVGSLVVAGKTPLEVSEQIAAQLRGRYVRSPEVAVNVEETVSQVITVDGQVQQPGLYPVIGKMTLIKAVAAARGTTEFARLQDVVVFRTVGDKQMAALYNLGAIRNGTYDDPDIYANDRIVVGDSPARRRFRDIIAVAPLLLAPVIAILQSGGI